MKPIGIALILLSSNAMALDFDVEWAKFDKDFARLNTRTVAMVSTPKITTQAILPEKNTADNVIEQVDPKSPERLGHKLSNAEMREHVQSLYKKPDAVVYSINLTE